MKANFRYLRRLTFSGALFLFVTVWIITSNKSPKVTDSLGALRFLAKTGVPPCGEVCSYSGASGPGKFYPFIQKPVNCRNILGRMINPERDGLYPPPPEPPPELLPEYLQKNECDLIHVYNNGLKHPEKYANYSHQTILDLMKKVRSGENINTYNDNGTVMDVLQKYSSFFTAKSGLVIGTKEPWLEAMLLTHRVENVVTSEYAELHVGHPKISTIHPTQLAAKFLAGKAEPFHFAASYSSIEHSGLGRYGDPLNPYGDMEAVAQVWCMVRPGGLFFLGVPFAKNVNKCHIVFNVHRLYGFPRLPHLTANWEVLDMFYGMNAPVLVLRKPNIY